MYIEVTFNRHLDSDADRNRFAQLLADQLVNEYGDMPGMPSSYGQRITKRGWGMGQSMVIDLRRVDGGAHIAKRAYMNQDLVVKLSSGLGAMAPEDPVKGRFFLRGRVVEGIKSAVGRPTRIDLTFAQAEGLCNRLADAMLRHPKCGISPAVEEDDD